MFARALMRPAKRNDSREVGSPLTSLQREMNRLFESFFSDFGDWSLQPLSGWWAGEREFTPRLNVSETDHEVRVTVELPGVDEKDLDISATRNTLTIRGEKRDEKEEKEESFYRVERSFGSFERTLPLPADVVTDQVDASFSKGILTITLPKTKEAQAQAKRIKVKAE
jgi:HSP20 family protein